MTFSAQLELWRQEPDLVTDMSIQRAGDNANAEWSQAAYEIVKNLCQNRSEFTADDVLEALELGEYSTKDKRALGAILRQAAKAGFCVPTGQFVKSRLPIRHRRPCCVWRSRI